MRKQSILTILQELGMVVKIDGRFTWMCTNADWGLVYNEDVFSAWFIS